MSNEGPKIIKRIEPLECPHCHNVIYASSQAMMPIINALVSEDDIKKAKQNILKRLEEIQFKDKKNKEEIIKWLEDENTLIDGSDIEPLLKQIAMEQLEHEKK